MSSAIHHKLTVLPGGKIELSDPQLKSGQSVDVFVVVPEDKTNDALSALDVLASAPGRQVFQTAEEVDRYLRNEREAWDH
jgi:hypothetical protein